MGCEYMTTTQVAKLLGVAQRTVVKWCKSGKLKAYRPGGRNFIVKAEDLDEFLERTGT